MGDVIFELGLLKADCKSYISLLPIPILKIIKDYVSKYYLKQIKYIIFDKQMDIAIYECNDKSLTDFFDYIKAVSVNLNVIYSLKISVLLTKIAEKNQTNTKYIVELTYNLLNNKHLLFDLLNENKRYCLKLRHSYVYEIDYYKNDRHNQQSKKRWMMCFSNLDC